MLVNVSYADHEPIRCSRGEVSFGPFEDDVTAPSASIAPVSMRRSYGAHEREIDGVRSSARCAKSFAFSRLVPTNAWADIQSAFVS